MTTQEFSDSFDTLLASYLHTQEFGEQSSQADVTLDEYEKSLFLTQAQDIVVKTYFEAHTNATGKGIDDSTERQIDFSSLVSYKKITQNEINTESFQYTPSGEQGEGIDKGTVFDDFFTTEDDATIEYWVDRPMFISYTGLLFSFNPENVGKLVVNILSSHSEEDILSSTYVLYKGRRSKGKEVRDIKVYADTIKNLGEENNATLYEVTINITDPRLGFLYIEGNDESTPHGLISLQYVSGKDNQDTFTGSDVVINLSSLNCLFILNERIIDVNNRSYVVVPLNYKEYDRISSKAYDEPLKRQAWRLFNNDENTVGVSTEIVMRSDAAAFKEYRVRYVRRPRPIVLVNLSDTNNSLNIDGYVNVTECELNPIIHNEILQLAVQLVLTSRGRMQQPSDNKEDRRQ